MSSASSAVTYTSVYTDSKPGRIRWTPYAAGSPTITGYIPGPEEPHEPDYVPDPIYPEYIPLEDEHVFLVEEQPLPIVDSPTAESPRYVTESDPEVDPQEIASTQAFIDAVTIALPSHPLPPLPPSLYIPPPVDRSDDTPESELPPRKRLCLSALGSRYEVGESSTSRLTKGRGIDYGFVSTLDAEARRRGIGEVGFGIRDTWVDLAEAEMAELRETDRRRQAQMVETLRVMGDLRREMGNMQAKLLALQEQSRRARQPVSDARVPDHQDASRDADSHI
nr:hypothetical protein [Tanacetum cinerariifolium]